MTLIFAFPDQEALARNLPGELAAWEWRHFPDGESYVRIKSDVRGKQVVILCSLNRPDERIMPLLFLARTLKDMAAAKVTLVAPYLGYMRQDARFQPGEAVTSEIFASVLSPFIDALVTIDPHLHRHARLEEIYRCKCTVVNAAALMGAWVSQHIASPILIGPDEESEQWVGAVAAAAQAPFIVLHKTRKGDRQVEITMRDMTNYRGLTPVIVDDMVSTAGTMIKAVHLLQQQQFSSVVCMAVHGLFAGDAYSTLIGSGATVVTANTVPHISNALDIYPLLSPWLA